MAAFNGDGIPNYNTEIRPWSDLPEDVLLQVIKRLLISDRIRFRAVCKGWRLAVDLIQGLFTTTKLPWTMEYMWKKTADPNRALSICKLREPDLHHAGSGPRSYTMETGMVEGRSNFVDAEACASRDGWVLFSKEEMKGSWLFFLFSPFNKQVVSLPRLESITFEVATFSSAPTSPDCFVFITHPLESDKIRISGYRPCGNDETWNSYVFDLPEYFESVESVGYMGGSFYCHFGSFWRMTSFNIANQEWQIIDITDYPCYDNDILVDNADAFRYSNPNYLLECEGELLLAYAARKSSCLYRALEELDDELFFLFRLDWKLKEWRWKNGGWRNGLGGGAIFIGKTSFWIPRGGETEIVADRVHHYSRGIPKFFYSPKDCPWYCLEEYREKCKICYHPCTEGLQTIWIAPPQEF